MGWKWFDDLKANAKQKFAQWNNATFKNGIMAACALMTAADGKVEAEEKKKVAKVIQTNELLSVFDAGELAMLFGDFIGDAQDDIARLRLVSMVGKLKGTEQAPYVMQVAIVIANADGEFAEVEKNVARELCRSLGLNAADYGI